MPICTPAENSWIRQQPWKPLALGALASIPAYLAIRALKYSPIASLATSALTFSAVTLTTGFSGKSKIEIQPPNTPPPPPLSWTDRVKANLERQGMPQEVLDLVTENPDLDALALAILKARTGQEGYASDSYVDLLDSTSLPIYDKIPSWEFQLQRDDLETLDLETCLGQWEQIDLGGTRYWTNEAQTYRDFFTQTSDAARLRQSLLNLGIRSLDMKDEPLDAAQLSPKIAKAFDRFPCAKHFEIWVGGQRFPACTALDYGRVLFTQDQLNNLTAEIIRQAIDSLNQEKVEIEDQTLYLQPDVTLPPGNRVLIDATWKKFLKERVKPELHALIDQQQGTLDDFAVRKALSTAIITAYWDSAPANLVYLVAEDRLYTGYDNIMELLDRKHVFSKDHIRGFEEARALQTLMQGKANYLVCGDNRVALSFDQVRRLFGQSYGFQGWQCPLVFSPDTKKLNYGESGTGYNRRTSISALEIFEESDNLPTELRTMATERHDLRQRLDGLGIEISQELDELLRHEADLEEISIQLSKAIFRAYRELKPGQPTGTVVSKLMVHSSRWEGMEKAEDCTPSWTKAEILGLTKKMLDQPQDIEMTVDGFGGQNTSFFLSKFEVTNILKAMGFGKFPEIKGSLKIERGGSEDKPTYTFTGPSLTNPITVKEARLHPLHVWDHKE